MIFKNGGQSSYNDGKKGITSSGGHTKFCSSLDIHWAMLVQLGGLETQDVLKEYREKYWHPHFFVFRSCDVLHAADHRNFPLRLEKCQRRELQAPRESVVGSQGEHCSWWVRPEAMTGHQHNALTALTLLPYSCPDSKKGQELKCLISFQSRWCHLHPHDKADL